MLTYPKSPSEKDLRLRLEIMVDTLTHIEEGRDNLRQFFAHTKNHDRLHKEYYQEIGEILLKLKEMGVSMDEFMFHSNLHVREWASTLI